MTTLTYDGDLAVAVGSSRRSKVWKNRTMKWSELLDRLSRTTRTPETVAEYRELPRSRQAEIKDCGGFVGGYLNEGRRTAVRSRSVLCLDADYADANLWPDFLMAYGVAAAVYSTHKHTPEKPRLRLVVPLAREVDPDEYQAIGRRIAATLGIDLFDDSSYQPERLMYWPSTSQDGEFFADSVDAPWLDPDTVLATYRDWKDISAWPVSSRQAAPVQKTGTKQQDPTEKPGLVGAFCRAYTIHDAIDTFIETYTPCDDAPGRYTYTEGSTAAGVVTYDDKYSYSHHATDPASGQLVNAWDLVRLHRFGELDADCLPETAATSRPSYKAMTALAANDPKVVAQTVRDRMAEAGEDFAVPVTDGEDWHPLLKLTEKGTIAQTIDNVVVILQHDPRLVERLAFNEMTHDIEAVSSLPWRQVREPSQWTDSDDSALRYYLEKVYGLSGKDRIFDAVNVVAQTRSYHPVRDYLDSCAWDGVPRVDTLLVDYLGAEDSAYTRAVTRKTLAAAVARIYRPGVKFDYMLTLKGRQGLGKSELTRRLGGQWHSDTFSTVQGKEAFEQVLGVWIMEVGELAGMKKAEAETIKLFISKQADRFRPAYGRRMQEYPRQCIFVGTTNESQFLRDQTGNRRFWVVDTPNQPRLSLFDELTPETVARIWGEAVEIYHKGEPLFLSRELEEEARRIQAGFTDDDPREGVIEEYLDRLLPEDWSAMDRYQRKSWLDSDAVGTVPRQRVSTVEVWTEALGGNPDRPDRIELKAVGSILAAMPGWAYQGDRRMRSIYGLQRYFERTEQ